MTIWMLKSKRNFVIGFIALLVLIPFLIGFFGELLEPTPKQSPQDPEKFKDPKQIVKPKYFVDTNGYAPEWSKNIGEEQALGKCMNIFAENIYGKLTPDKKWCNEFMGFLGDEMDQQMNDMGFNT